MNRLLPCNIGEKSNKVIKYLIIIYIESNKEVYRNATYHITLQDILNGINKDNAKPYIEKGLLDKIGDYKHTNALLQLIVFNEMIYNIYDL